MTDKRKAIDPIPASFSTAREAGEFWDTHSTADYLEFLEPADHTIDIQERIYEVQVPEDLFEKLEAAARSTHQSLPSTLERILRKEFSAV